MMSRSPIFCYGSYTNALFILWYVEFVRLLCEKFVQSVCKFSLSIAKSFKSFQIILTSDLEILQSAISAFPRNQNLLDRQSRSLECFSRLVRHSNESIASENLFKLGFIAQSLEQLKPVIFSLDSPIYDIRMSAALAIEQNSLTDSAIKKELLKRVNNADEASDIRQVLLSALKRFN